MRTGWTVPPNSITIPSNADPDQPRIVITADPEEIVTSDYTISAAILFYWNATDFFYIGVTALDGDGYLVIGAEAPSVSDSHIYAEMDFVTSIGDILASIFLEGRYDGGFNTHGSLYLDSWAVLDGPDLLALETSTGGIGEYQMQVGVDDVPMSWGTMGTSKDAAAVTPIAAEVVVDTVTPTVGEFDFGRRCRIEFSGRVQSTVAGNRVGFRIRRGSAAGTIERECGEMYLAAASIAQPVDLFTLVDGTNAADTYVLTCRRTAGAGTITYTPDSGIGTDETSTSI